MGKLTGQEGCFYQIFESIVMRSELHVIALFDVVE